MSIIFPLLDLKRALDLYIRLDSLNPFIIIVYAIVLKKVYVIKVNSGMPMAE